MTSVIVVEPRAQGGLAAHVRMERDLLRDMGIEVLTPRVHIGSRPHPWHDARSWTVLRALMRSHSGARVHAHGLRAGALTALAAPSARSVVVTIHNRPDGSRLSRALGTRLLRIVAARARTVLAVSPDLEHAATHAGARDVRHAIIPAPSAPPSSLPTPADASKPRPDYTGVRPLRILVIGRLAPQKGLDDLLDALAILAARDVSVQVSIAGEGPLRSHLHYRIADENAPVELLGHRSDIAQLIAGTDLVVSAARWEGQPVALQEVIAHGCPLIATDAGGTRWVTGDGATLVPVADSRALAEAIQRHTDPAVLAQAAVAAAARAPHLPTADDLRTQLIDVLDLHPDPEESDRDH